MFGLQTPQQAVLQNVDSTKPKEAATERAITELMAQDRFKDPTTADPPIQAD